MRLLLKIYIYIYSKSCFNSVTSRSMGTMSWNDPVFSTLHVICTSESVTLRVFAYRTFHSYPLTKNSCFLLSLLFCFQQNFKHKPKISRWCTRCSLPESTDETVLPRAVSLRRTPSARKFRWNERERARSCHVGKRT